nr:MAG TPA: hypothetical protein [Microviridae sp.]
MVRLYYITCCSRSSRVCGKVEKCFFFALIRRKSTKKNVENFVENLLKC